MTRTVRVLALGGTIAMAGTAGGGVVPTLGADALVSRLPQLADVARVQARSLASVAGSAVTMDDVLGLAAEVTAAARDGVDGLVVTQGTDTIEETAFLLDLLCDTDRPLVVTGALRNPTLPGADGPANLLAAVQVAASATASGLGCVVVLNDEIHAARFVRKAHTANPAAFSSPLAGPIGWVAEGRPRVLASGLPSAHVPVAGDAPDPPVALLSVTLGDEGRLLDAIGGLGYAGLVVEALGGGHVPPWLVDRLTHLAATMPVVLCSRTAAGEVLRATYGFAGSESDLLGRGLISGGWLDARKSRLLLKTLLRAGVTTGRMPGRFQRWLSAAVRADR